MSKHPTILEVLYLVLMHMEGRPREIVGLGVFTKEELHEWVQYYFSSEGPL